jgi:class 3 adenylate cyclase
METSTALPGLNAKLLDEKLGELEKARTWNPRVISKLETLLNAPDDFQVFRINPLQFATERNLSEQEAVDLFLHGTKLGLFKMEWQVLCPVCGDTMESFEALSSVHPHYFCHLCHLEGEARLDDYIQISFTVSPRVRDIRFHHPETLSVEDFHFKYHFNQGARIPGGPKFIEAVAMIGKGMAYLSAGEVKTFEFDSQAGLLIGHDLIHGVGFMVPISGETPEGGAKTQKLRAVLRDGRFILSADRLSPGKILLEAGNDTVTKGSLALLVKPSDARPGVLQFEPFLNGNKLLTNQTFRNLFRSETVVGHEGIGVRDLTLLFTDLKGSTALYERIGDLKAFSLVQQHFDRLGKAVQANRGAVVKTIGDAVMASFEKPEDAVRAALEMLKEIEEFNGEHGVKEIILKIGIHRGASIAVTLNDRLDYFGQTVNIAARVQGLAGAEEIYLTRDVFESAGVEELLKGFSVASQEASLRGIQKAMKVYRVTDSKG